MAALIGQQPVVLTAADEMDAALATLMQDANGSDAYNNTRVMMGHIEAGKFLIVPDEFDEFCELVKAKAPAIDLATLGQINGVQNYVGKNAKTYTDDNPLMTTKITVQNANPPDEKLTTLKIIAMNFMSLLNAGVDDISAAYASMLRANWCMRGAYVAMKADTSTTSVEHVVVDDAHPTLGAINAAADQADVLAALGNNSGKLIDVMKSAQFGAKWVTLYAQNIWCAVEHVFRVRSHHFKTTGSDAASYDMLYTKYLNACYAGEGIWPVGLDKFAVFHTAIHPFRIRALPIVAAHFAAHGLVADAAIVRFSGSPCGNAVLTTTEAALTTLAGEVWYSGFATAYEVPIAKLAETTRQILNDKYAYHIAAALYGIDHKTMVYIDNEMISIESAKAQTSMLASAGSGLISALAYFKENKVISTYALSNARALEKPAASNPLLSVKVNQIISASMNAITDATDLNAMLEQVLPRIEA